MLTIALHVTFKNFNKHSNTFKIEKKSNFKNDISPREEHIEFKNFVFSLSYYTVLEICEHGTIIFFLENNNDRPLRPIINTSGQIIVLVTTSGLPPGGVDYISLPPMQCLVVLHYLRDNKT